MGTKLVVFSKGFSALRSCTLRIDYRLIRGGMSKEQTYSKRFDTLVPSNMHFEVLHGPEALFTASSVTDKWSG